MSKIVENRDEPTVDASDAGSVGFIVAPDSAGGSPGEGVGNYFSYTTGAKDSIYALDLSGTNTVERRAGLFHPCRVFLKTGERVDFLPEFTRAVGGEVTLEKKHHTAGAQLFAGSKALKTFHCTALLDTGNPASFIQENVWLRMLACEAASYDGKTAVRQKTWGGVSWGSVGYLESCTVEHTSGSSSKTLRCRSYVPDGLFGSVCPRFPRCGFVHSASVRTR